MQLGGIYSGQTDTGVQKVNAAMQKSVDMAIEDMKKNVAMAATMEEQAQQMTAVEKGIGQNVNIQA